MEAPTATHRSGQNITPTMASEFPSPFRGTKDPLAHQIEKFVEKLDMLRPEKGGPAYLGNSGALAYNYPDVKNVAISQKMGDLDAVLDDVVKLFRRGAELGQPADDVQRHPAGQHRGDHRLDAVAGVLGQYSGRRIRLERPSRRTRNGGHAGQSRSAGTR